MTPADIDMSNVMVSSVTSETWLVIMPVVLCIAGGAVLAGIRRRIDFHAPFAIFCLAALTAVDALLLYRVATDGPITMVLGRWLPPFGIAFTVDVLGALLALTSAAIATAVATYSLVDIDRNARRYGFYPMLLFLMAGVSGAFLTGDVFNLYVWFEVLLISSFGLLVLGGEREQIDGATKYGLLNLVATTLFLIATGYLYAIFGTLNMADIAEKVEKSAGTLPLMTLATLFLVAFGMKAAAFPVNFWLPAAYHTPRITVSAVFAGLLTKVGIYAILRILVMIMPGEGEALRPLVWCIAIVTMMAGSVSAIAANDIRKTFAYWVIAGIGVMLAGLSLGGNDASSATIFYMLHSMVTMTALYLLAGQMAHAGGGYDLDRLGGIYQSRPLLAALAMILLFSVSGLPPFSGFWPKAMLVKAALARGDALLAGTILLSGFLMTLAAGRVAILTLWRPAREALLPPSVQRFAFGALMALSVPVVIAGLWPEPFQRLSSAAAAGLIDPAAYIRSVFPEPRP